MSATVSWSLETDGATRGTRRTRLDARPGPLRLTRRGRVVIAVAAFLLACSGVVAAGGAQAGAPHRGVEVTRHVVEPGETLWALAGSVASPREDLRDVVAEIEKLNDLDGAGLRAGEQLLLPVARG